MEKNKLTVLTEQDITKADKLILSAKQLNFLFQKTPKTHVFKRPGKGGDSWEYVTGTYMKKVLNLMFGFNWDFEIVQFDMNIDAKQCIVLGKLTCRNGEQGQIIKTQFGRADIKFKKDKPQTAENTLDLGNDLKAAATDALKKCASELGIASDIYGKNEFKEIYVVDKKPSVDQLMLLDEIIDQAKLNDQEIKRIKFDLPKMSSSEVSVMIDGLKQMIDETTGITNNSQHLDRIQKEVYNERQNKIKFNDID